MNLSFLFFWTTKTAEDNAWHPVPGQNPTKYVGNLPPLIKRQDLEAACVDIAPFVAGAGALAYIRQLNDFGFTASANVFQNPRTLMAMHRSTLIVTPVVLLCQAFGVEYRRFIPRWSQTRERGRDEEMVRQQVGFGMLAGVAIWTLRIYALRRGRTYWAPIDVVMGGALADVMHREYVRAHGY
ncbi:unnamed protein product [Aureobasidium mustum]|uniref:Uncharacterized protein n=1 Tax=Aureobasidium mustum TaxID=2773714 RepID=A0A9N8K976_9PEZI|nr:unnamed protein product [Aureobasidium mustum]